MRNTANSVCYTYRRARIFQTLFGVWRGAASAFVARPEDVTKAVATYRSLRLGRVLRLLRMQAGDTGLVRHMYSPAFALPTSVLVSATIVRSWGRYFGAPAGDASGSEDSSPRHARAELAARREPFGAPRRRAPPPGQASTGWTAGACVGQGCAERV